MKSLLFLILISFYSNAQQNYQSGFVVLKNQQKLEGIIDNREWTISPSKINFRPSLQSPVKVLTVDDISSFEVNGEVYFSKECSIEKLERDFNKTIYFKSVLDYTRRTIVVKQIHSFVRSLANGKVNLYEFVDSDSEKHYLVEDNTKLIPLVYHVIGLEGQAFFANEYKNQLSIILENSCNTLSIDQVQYKGNSIAKLIENYNNCFATKSDIIIPKREVSNIIQFGVLLGGGLSTLSYDYFNDTSNGFKNWSINPNVGVFLNIVAPRGRGKLALQNEVSYYSFNRVYAEQSTTTGTLFTTEYNYLLSYVGIKNMIRYKLRVSEPSIYILAGINNGFVIKNVSYYKQIGFGSGQNQGFNEDIRKHEQALLFGIGSELSKKISVEIKYQTGNGFSPYVYKSTNTKEASLQIKYYFKK